MNKIPLRVICVAFFLGFLFPVLTGAVLAEYTYLPSGAASETYTDGGVWRGRTSSTTGVAHYRAFAHIRGWGGSDTILKDEKAHDCYHCLSTDDRVKVATLWNYGVTQHRSRRVIGDTEYAGYTSHNGTKSSYGCWVAYCW